MFLNPSKVITRAFHSKLILVIRNSASRECVCLFWREWTASVGTVCHGIWTKMYYEIETRWFNFSEVTKHKERESEWKRALIGQKMSQRHDDDDDDVYVLLRAWSYCQVIRRKTEISEHRAGLDSETRAWISSSMLHKADQRPMKAKGSSLYCNVPFTPTTNNFASFSCLFQSVA